MSRRRACWPALLLAAPLAVAAAQPLCRDSPRYRIVEGATGEVGTHFLVKRVIAKNARPACEYRVEPGDFEIRNEAAEYFMALQQDLLILDSGTGPEPRGLVIWNVAARRKVYAGSYAGPWALAGGRLRFWLETGPATADNCPQAATWRAGGLGAAIETRVSLDLARFHLTRSAQTRCSPRQ